MRDDVVLEWVGKNYYISPVVPVVIGSCFLVTYVAPLGPHVIQALSYVDVFNFSLLAILFCILVALECLAIYGLMRLASRLLGFRKPSRSSGFRIIYGLVGLYVLIAVVTYFSAFDFYGKYLDFTLLFLFVPLIYLILVIYLRDVQIMLSLGFLVGYSFLAGMTFGYFDAASIELEDEICTETCRRVDVHIVLAAYVVVFDESGRTLLINRADVKSMTVARDNQ